MTNQIEIHGFCDERFASVKDVFAQNFENGLEIGASMALTIDGEYVIDLWAGHSDLAKTRPWEKDTIVNVYSTTKIMTALCALMLVDQGLLDVEAPVADYWPEFAQNGKDKLPVKYLFSHSAGLSGLDLPMKKDELYDWDLVCERLAAQKPLWEPGTANGYHAVTFGHLLGELVRRITGKSLGTYFKEKVADKLDADFYIGLPAEHDDRVAQLSPPEMIRPQAVDPEAVVTRTWRSFVLDARDSETRAWRAAEIPASNGHGNARSVARVGSLLACGGELDGHKIISKPTLEKAIEEQIYGIDLVLGMPLRFGLGWGLASEHLPFPANTFYWSGWGGSTCIMNMDTKSCFSYAMNNMVQSLTGDPRTMSLGAAIFPLLNKGV